MARGSGTHYEVSRVPKDRIVGGHFATEMGPEIAIPDEEITTLCGEQLWASYRSHKPTTVVDHVSCTKCRRKLDRQRLAQVKASGVELRVEPDKSAKGAWRTGTGSKAFVGDALVGYVGFQEHYWRVYKLRLSREDGQEPAVINAHYPLKEDGEDAFLGYRSWHLEGGALAYKTKEDALLACVDLRAKGYLKTGPELREASRAALEHWRAQAVIRDRKKADAAQHLADTLEGLAELMDRADLTNFQRQAAANAIDLLKKPRDD